MKLTGINPVMLRNLIERGSFTEAPPGQRGVPRYFARDDLVALVILKVLLDLKFQPSYAAKIASEIRRKMRKSENIEELYLAVATNRKGGRHPKVVDSPPDDGKAPFPFRIALYRAQAEADITRIVGKRKAH